ncbi:basic 7S globulin-like protein [Tanacetum coccineum]|uniref:Basic 7S globulin-like protein n=1 Tax=Tanacetum coccineum TaxID=301880 RepID=A0ABQ5IGT6_9ASTR
MLWLRKLILLLLVFISHEYEAIAQYAIPYTSLVVPVNKHTDLADPLYSAQVVTSWEVPEHKKAKLLIDIDAPFSWHDCIVQWNIYPGSCPTNMLCESGVSCDEYQCTEVRSSYSYKNFLCPQVPNNSPGWGFCSCPVNVVNPITGSCDQGRFSKVTKPIPRAKPVTPFGLCFKSFTNGTGVSLKVPNIDFSLQEGKKWSISTANSIKQVTDDVACLAFVDGGTTSEHAIVIGTFQFEDNFLMFDLENSTFGFSSSLLSKQTSCANFNFTIIPRN